MFSLQDCFEGRIFGMQIINNGLTEVDLFYLMGSQNSEIDNDQFRKADWQEESKDAQIRVWRSRSQHSQRLEEYDVCTQNDDQLKHQKKAFELRRRNPLLAAAYYFQSYPRDNFCSSVSRHSLFIERIPIRLEDVEHVPYPDYLHLFDAALKGFGQLARWAGFFPVEEGMVGINQQGVAKAWLSEDLASSRPFGRATEPQMVGSLVEAIDRNIDHDQLPPSTPTVRNFLYRNSDTLTFDAAIREFGEFVRCFNSGQVPIKLECIDEAGGVYAIANRDKTNSSLRKSNVRRSQVKAGSTVRSNNPLILATPPPVSTYMQLPPLITPVQHNGQSNHAKKPLQISPPFFQAPVSSQKAGQPIFIASNKQINPNFIPRVANAPKFTVEVTPGKVYPQKNSTIFMNGSSKVIPTETNGTNQPSLLQKIHPRFATSQKQVQGTTEMPLNSLKVVEHVVVEQAIPEILEDAVVEHHIRNPARPAPDSKRSITEVFIPDEPASDPVHHQLEEHALQAVQDYKFVEFRDAVSIPQESNPNSLAVSFNPAFEHEEFAHNSHSSHSGQHYQGAEGDNIRQTGKFALNFDRAVRAEEGVQSLTEDDLIRETGKFNLHQSSGREQWRGQDYGDPHYDQLYNLHRPGQHNNGESYHLSGRGDNPYKQFGSILSQEAQADPPQYPYNSGHGQSGSNGS